MNWSTDSIPPSSAAISLVPQPAPLTRMWPALEMTRGLVTGKSPTGKQISASSRADCPLVTGAFAK